MIRFILKGFFSTLISSSGLNAQSNQTEPKVYSTNWDLHFEGRHIYQKLCFQCHGELGKGDGEWSKDLKTNPPRNFHIAIFKLRSTPTGKLPTDADLKRSILQGVSGTAMPSFKNSFQDKGYDAAIEYIKCFSKKWRDPSNYGVPIAIPPVPEWLHDKKLNTHHRQKGYEIYKVHCQSCHGIDGLGNGPASKGQKDFSGFPLQPANLTHPIKSGKKSEDLYRAIATGLDGTPMIGYSHILSPLETWQLTSWIESIRIDF